MDLVQCYYNTATYFNATFKPLATHLGTKVGTITGKVLPLYKKAYDPIYQKHHSINIIYVL